MSNQRVPVSKHAELSGTSSDRLLRRLLDEFELAFGHAGADDSPVFVWSRPDADRVDRNSPGSVVHVVDPPALGILPSHLVDHTSQRFLAVGLVAGTPLEQTFSLPAVVAAGYELVVVDDLEDAAKHSDPFRAFCAHQTGDAHDHSVIEAAGAGLPIVASVGNSSANDLLVHGLTGLIVADTTDGWGWGARHISAVPADAQRFGIGAKRRVASRSWALVEQLGHEIANPCPRKRVCIVNTFAIDDAVNGGQRRLRQLAGELARHADVEVLVLSQHAERERRRLLAPGLVQIEVPRSATQRDAEAKIYELLGEPTDDMTISDLAITSPAWANLLSDRLADADVIVSSHPYLAPTIPEIPSVPFVYDSHNAESSFKQNVLADDENGRWLLKATERAEQSATRRANLILGCTEADISKIGLLDPDRDHLSAVVSNGVDIDALPFAELNEKTRARWELLDLAGVDAYSERPITTFIGSSHAPNVAAAELLLATARQRPEWLFILAGSHTSGIAERNISIPANVTLIPVFDEGLLWPLIAGADAAVNPMLSGGGSNLKIFDYLAVGTPVLATATGARGLDDAATMVELVDATPTSVAAGLDRLIDPATIETRAHRSRAGRAFVEHNVNWRTLGLKWAESLGVLVDGWPGPERPTTLSQNPIILFDAPPLANDASIATMQRVRNAAADGTPTSREITVDPAFREHIRKAKANRNVGRELPDDARLALPKKALIRAGHALSNEQVVYNEASLAATERLMEVINDLRRDQLALTERLEAAEAALANVASSDRDRSVPAPPSSAPPRAVPTDSSTTQPAKTAAIGSAVPPDSRALDAFYEAFEDRFRGDPQDIATSSAHYLDRIADAPDGQVIDIGCGRGEWLSLVAQTGRPATGFDTNEVAIERCRAAGLDAMHGDGIAHLETAVPASIAVVSAFHVIEHLEFDQLHRLVVAALRALKPGGKLVLETPNCLNLQVGASSFWLDPTHLSPVHPEQLRFLLEHVGFGTVDIFGLHPDEGSTPTDIDPDPVRNGLLSELHRLVFGPLDLAAIATKQ